MSSFKFFPILFLLVNYSQSFPVENQASLSQVLSSTADGEGKAADLLGIPGAKAYIHSYSDGGDGENEQGFYRRQSGDGSDGYKHYDGFDSKKSDKYAFEAHSAFGKYAGQDVGIDDTEKHHKKRSPFYYNYQSDGKASREGVDADYEGGHTGEISERGGDHYVDEGDSSGADVERESHHGEYMTEEREGDVDTEADSGYVEGADIMY